MRECGSLSLVFFLAGEQLVTDDLRPEVTPLLDAIRGGNLDARNQLVHLVYDELRRVAGGLMQRERAGHTLQPTDLVNEVFLRLLHADDLARAQDRAHFFAAAARAMRNILVDHARRRATEKRGGGQEFVPLDEALDYFASQKLDVLAVHEALEQLAALHERQSQIVELRFFGGYTVEEVAELLEVSVSTVEGDFRKATAFLHSQLVEDP
jgi:RNA polymerase sigma factor (TIGR02999 family)